jgi:hypothetical protein
MYFKSITTILTLLTIPLASLAMDEHVYTIGAYDQAFSQQEQVMKLGPLPANEVPPALPSAFLEKDGSYGGGEAFQTIEQACLVLKQQLASGVLPSTEVWHIYLLDANWNQDTYPLHPHDFRISRTVRVVSMARKEC